MVVPATSPEGFCCVRFAAPEPQRARRRVDAEPKVFLLEPSYFYFSFLLPPVEIPHWRDAHEVLKTEARARGMGSYQVLVAPATAARETKRMTDCMIEIPSIGD